MDRHGPEEREGMEREGFELQISEAERGSSSWARQLEAIFEAMTDGIFVFDKDGRLLQMNRAARNLLGLSGLPGYTALSLEERGALITQRYVQGQSLPLAQWATTRVLNGEVLTGMTAVEFTIRGLRGREMRINLSGAPIRDQEGNIVGAINICRDVTHRWKLEQCLQKAFHALLLLTQALAQLPQDSRNLDRRVDGEQPLLPAATHLIGQRLVELARSVLGCRCVGLTAFEQETGLLHPVAIAGLSPEHKRRFRLNDSLTPTLLARLQAGEIVFADLSKIMADWLPGFNAGGVLIAPLQLEPRLKGILWLDYGSQAHSSFPEEDVLAGIVEKLITVMIEREHFLQESALMRTQELALHEVTQRIDEFLGIVAHELRTPLADLRGFAQTLLIQTALGKGPQLAAWQEKALTGLDLAADQLGKLTDDLLDMARLQAGHLELYLEPTDLVALVQRIVTRLQMTTQRHTLSCLPSMERLVTSVDPQRIEQVIGNLIRNAIKYSPEGGPIDVTLTEEIEKQEALLAVSDHGLGIPAQQQEQIFQRFVQAENARASGITGAGLGLYLCRALIKRHGGRIWCESVEGQGSTFFVALPVVFHAQHGRTSHL